jgi:hypothetical protein
MKPPVEAPFKKPYSPPKLLVYGDLTELTLTSSIKGMRDGGKLRNMTATGGR